MLRLRLLAFALCFLSIAAPSARGAERRGVLVVAHGGNSEWNAAVRKAVKQAHLDAPAEVAFGMGMHPEEVRTFQQAVNRLERRGVDQILVVALLVSSHSEVYRQYEYLFGLRPKPEWQEAGEPLDLEVPVVIGQTLESSPFLEAILLDRAKALSQQADEETVVLVAHGPNDEADNQLWLRVLGQVAATIKQEGGFLDVVSLTMRDDAPEAIHQEASQALRKLVEERSQQGRVLVIPVLIAKGGIERKIPQMLAGLSYVYRGETLLPHPKMIEWIRSQAARTETSSRQAEGRSRLVHAFSVGGSVGGIE